MSTTIKSALGGFLAGVAVTVAIGASSTSSPGRYQITSAANYLAVIDTATGKVWAGNFNQLGPGAQAVDFRTCPQGASDFFKEKSD